MVSRRTNFGERSEPAPDRGGKLQSAGGRHKVTFRHWCSCRCPRTGAGSGPLKLLFSVAHGIMLRAPTDALQLRGSGAARTGPILLSNEFKYI